MIALYYVQRKIMLTGERYRIKFKNNKLKEQDNLKRYPA